MAQVAIANQNGMFIIGIEPKNVLSKNHLVHVQLDNILPITPLHEAQNAIASKILSMIQKEVNKIP